MLTLEGPEGAGKSTQIELLAAWLRGLGLPVLQTREPGEGPIGAKIRQLILDPASDGLLPRTEALLYAADRAQHVESCLRPALERGEIVLCDRYADSTLAYQGFGRGLDLDFLRQINRMATDGLSPDLTILLDLPVEIGLERAGARAAADRMEQEKIDFHRRLAAGFLRLAAAEPERFRVVDASQAVEAVQEAIRIEVRAALAARGLI